MIKLLKLIYFIATTLPSSALAHSWVERLMKIHRNGTMVGNPGFVRGAVSRLDPRFNDSQMQHLLPPNDRATPRISTLDRMCKESQLIGYYSPDLPQLEAHAGEYISVQYQENGHITLPQNTPNKDSSGTVYIYGTSEPSDDDTLLSIHKVWNKDRTGGDRRGSLLAIFPFDDGRCYQVNNQEASLKRQREYVKVPMNPQGADLWCQNDIKLPVDVSDSFTLYWVWDWPSNKDPMEEIYTSCIDIKIIPGSRNEVLEYIDGQDLNTAAIKKQLQAWQ
ncbi:hypothetical protein BFJ70_g16515 [Fusarium oxysporum]|nr:hypothetical protein BFJ70_g16515 [Fusarium oxysporum]